MATTLFQQLPWDGGLNASLDEAMIPTAQLTVADNIVMDSRGSKRKREGISHNWDNATSGTDSIIALHDFWWGTATRTQRMLGISSTGNITSYASGVRTALTDAGTAWTGTLTSASILTFNNKAIFAVDGATNVIKMWDGSSSVADLPGSPPKASFLIEHLGRIWCNDKNNKDLFHYSPTNDHTQWNGAGDSGAIPIAVGDGDPEGITAGVSFGGDLYVFKRRKIYKLVGYEPESIQIVKLSDNLGCVSQSALRVVDNKDIIWVSEDGVHSLSAFLSTGESSISGDIQRLFNEDLSFIRLKYAQVAYVPSINSVAIALTEEASSNRLNTTSSVNNALYFFHLKRRQWWRWPDVSCQSLVVMTDADMKRLYIGTHTGRVSKAWNGLTYDVSMAAAQVAIKRSVSTGIIFVDGSPFTLKSFKRFVLYYKPKGRQTTSVSFRIDGQSIAPENSLSFSNATGASALGLGFELGATQLGSAGLFAAYAATVNGVGRGCKIIIEESSLTAQSDIEGFAVEYEPAGYFYEGQ